ncbi:MAG: hypothetical protein HRT36_08260 [Alphaproteobacteria bacterium]|nr:hypothetical protein [Alphaproteobacteria bacterium]
MLFYAGSDGEFGGTGMAELVSQDAEFLHMDVFGAHAGCDAASPAVRTALYAVRQTRARAVP